MSEPFSFHLHATCGKARLGQISTPHGTIRTPAFMPVGTAATVKAMYPEQIKALGADIILGNTYHLMLRPSAERIQKLGGLHHFMRWPHPILTDSGGFQVMSLARLRAMREDGVYFQSHIDGSKHFLSPERSIEIQMLLGSDIQMQLDECIALPATEKAIESAMHLSIRWAERCKNSFTELGGFDKGHALFGIVQGGDNTALRIESAERLVGIDFPGYAIGGLAVGEPQAVMLEMLETTLPYLPENTPRYLMGVGTPDDLVESVARGIDMFDCVMPTRAGRHGLAYTQYGKVNFRNARHKEDPRPLDETSDCPATSQYSRAYLHHLIRCNEYLGAMLITWNNLHYYQKLMADMREAIAEDRFESFYKIFKNSWAQSDIAEL